MSRSLAILRKLSFPLVACLGVGLLILGWFEWRRFYDELYLEEMRAIGAAVDAGATVRYQRAGESMERIATGPDHKDAKRYDLGDWPEGRSKAPANSPFLGRVEILHVDDPAFPPLTSEAGHALLTLPGLKSFSGEFGPASGSDAQIEQALGFDLPKLPEAELTKEDLLNPLPRGEAVDEAKQAEIVGRIVEAWSRRDAPPAYVLHARFCRRDSDEFAYDLVEAIDRERVALQTIPRDLHVGMGPQPPCENGLRLYDGARMFRIDRQADSWRRVARYDREATPSYFPNEFAWMPPPGSPPRFYADGRAIDRAYYWLQQAWPDSTALLGRQGENVAAIERLPAERWRIVLAPHRSTVARSEREAGAKLSRSRTIEVEAVLRADLGFAVEASRIVATLDDASTRHENKEYLFTKRRLAEVDGLVYSAECLDLRSSQVLDLQAPREPDFTHSDVDRVQTSAIVVPSIRDAAFDPRSYDPTPWPEARELPSWRTYGAAWFLGGALCLVGVAGTLVGRRSDRPAPSESLASERQRKVRRRLPRLRFGLTSLFAAALLSISAAGVVKEKRDEATQEIALLGRVSGHVYVERAEPQFPWSVFSTLTLPIDAPVRRVLIDDHWKKPSEELSDEDVRRLLELPELESFRYLRSERRDEPQDAFAFARQALARPLPAPVEEWDHLHDPDGAIPSPFRRAAAAFRRARQSRPDDDAMPDGTDLSNAERDAYVANLVERWSQASESFPQRYLMAVDPDTDPGHVSVTLRDGERYWSAADARDLRDSSDKFLIRCQDDRYRYAFAPAQNGAVLVERSRLGVPYLLSVNDKAGAESLGARMQDRDYPGNVEFAAIRAPAPPFAFPRVLDRAEFPESVAAAALDPRKIRRVARVSDLRHRLEFDPTTIAYGSDGVERIEISELVVIVRDDLDCAVASAEFHRAVTLLPEEKKPPDRRFFRIDNVLTQSPEGVVVPERTIVWSDKERSWMSKRSDARFAYDFAPAIDPRIFSRPSMSELDPLPEPKPRRVFAWPMATGSLAVGLLAVAAIGSLRRTLLGPVFGRGLFEGAGGGVPIPRRRIS